MTEGYSLSEPRQKQYEEAAEILKNPYIGTDPVDYEEPSLSSDVPSFVTTDSAISMPY